MLLEMERATGREFEGTTIGIRPGAANKEMIKVVGHRQERRGTANVESGTAPEQHTRDRVFEDVSVLRSRLSAYLSAQAGFAVVVESLTKFPAGFSWITYGMRVSGYPQAQDIILRIGPPYGLFAPYSAMPEFQSFSALKASAVPVPRAFMASDDASILGAPFFLCERVDGDTPLPWGGEQNAALDGARREALAQDFVDALAALHAFDWRETSLANWESGLTTDNVADRQIDFWWERFQRWALRPHPMAHRAFAWLRQNQPKAPRVAIVHGDYRLGNFLERGDRITAILDWELVHLGDPIEDLGWAFLPQYRGGTGLVCGLASEEAFLARYEERAGIRVDRAALNFYIVFSLLKLALTHMAAARCFEDGLFNDMRMPAMATQIAPVFRQIAKALERTK
ncbi:aminoglycoside phosphotransferase (APT) family kinase protein [Nitrobacteraceae bacterium AZCC 2161]